MTISDSNDEQNLLGGVVGCGVGVVRTGGTGRRKQKNVFLKIIILPRFIFRYFHATDIS